MSIRKETHELRRLENVLTTEATEAVSSSTAVAGQELELGVWNVDDGTSRKLSPGRWIN